MLASRAVSAREPHAEPPAPPAPEANGAPRVHPTVVALGATSLFTDLSTEMLIPVLPLFITSTLHASVASLGIIEGIAESTASLLRLGSGWLSDRIGRRKPFLVAGYGISTLAKGSMALAGSWWTVLGLRFADRLGKGVRNPPRDALIADVTEPRARGRAFGLHRAMDTLGAALGPLAAFALLAAWPGNLRRVFAASLVPGALSVAVLLLFVRARPAAPRRGRGLHAEARALGAPFVRFLVADGVFQLANSSLAFVLLRASRGGVSTALVPLAYLVYNLVYAALAMPVGLVADRYGRRRLLVAAYALYAAIYGALAWSAAPAVVVAALATLGVHSALLEVSERSLVADLVPRESVGTAFGVHHTVVGLALLPASVGAGLVWDHLGAGATFGLDAGLALAAAAVFVLWPPRPEPRPEAA